MKKLSAVLLFGIISQNVYAIDVNGQDAEESMFPQIGKINAGKGLCTGSFVGEKWFLTAAHCVDLSNNDSYVELSNARSIDVAEKHIIRTNEDDPRVWDVDIALIKLKESPDIEQISFISPEPLEYHDVLDVYGFASSEDLRKGSQQVWFNNDQYDKGNGFPPNDDYLNYPWIETLNLDQGETQEGDSGGPWFKDGAIVGVHVGLSTYEYEYGWGSRLTKIATPEVLNWITSTIDDWHFAPHKKLQGVGTITVQSLHVNSVVDSSYTEGDVTIDFENSTCTQQVTIEPFDTCTYVVQSNGGKGKVFLSDKSFVEINGEIWSPEPPMSYEPVEVPQSSGGGSIPFQMIPLVLLFWGFRKK